MKGLIYKITGSCGKCYYGSTINLRQRLAVHYSDTNSCSSNQLQKPFNIEVVRQCDVSKRKILYVLEKWYILNNECVNKNVPLFYKTKQEANNYYYKENKECILTNKNKKVECLKCGLMVSNQNVKKHPTTKLCKEVSKKVNQLQEEIERLKKIITDNNLKI